MEKNKLTAKDVEEQRFSVVRGGKDGYSMKEVDKFLDQIEVTMSVHEKDIEKISQDVVSRQKMVDELINKVNLLEEEADSVKGILSAARQDHAAAVAEVDQLKSQLRLEANRNGELAAMSGDSTQGAELVARLNSLEEERDALLEQNAHLTRQLDSVGTAPDPAVEKENPTSLAASIIANASEVADRVVNEANARREEILATTEAAVSQVKADLEKEVEAAKAKAKELRDSTFERLETEKRDLEASVKSLRDFESGFRADLEEYLSNLHRRVVDYVPAKSHNLEIEDEPQNVESEYTEYTENVDAVEVVEEGEEVEPDVPSELADDTLDEEGLSNDNPAEAHIVDVDDVATEKEVYVLDEGASEINEVPSDGAEGTHDDGSYDDGIIR